MRETNTHTHIHTEGGRGGERETSMNLVETSSFTLKFDSRLYACIDRSIDRFMISFMKEGGRDKGRKHACRTHAPMHAGLVSFLRNNPQHTGCQIRDKREKGKAYTRTAAASKGRSSEGREALQSVYGSTVA
mmetsp:Transcript_2037/g.4288  ORF Transcript_2037/g.4288 Transcript_2037/m.4288 type:complete len:132 (-) Transcript_2037:371-766(-)